MPASLRERYHGRDAHRRGFGPVDDPHPYVIGTSAVGRYLTVAEECAKAGLLRVP